MKSQVKESTSGFQVVKFRIGALPFAVNIENVREIIYYREAMPMPDAPSFVEGVLDLRGLIIPVIDLKRKLGIEDPKGGAPNHILILHLDETNVGMVVDEVMEVLRILDTDLQAPHRIHKGPGSRYLVGVVKRGDEMVYVLDLDRLLTSDEKASISEIRK